MSTVGGLNSVSLSLTHHMVMILDAMERPAAVHVFTNRAGEKKLTPSIRFTLHFNRNTFHKFAVTQRIKCIFTVSNAAFKCSLKKQPHVYCNYDMHSNTSLKSAIYPSQSF